MLTTRVLQDNFDAIVTDRRITHAQFRTVSQAPPAPQSPCFFARRRGTLAACRVCSVRPVARSPGVYAATESLVTGIARYGDPGIPENYREICMS